VDGFFLQRSLQGRFVEGSGGRFVFIVDESKRERRRGKGSDTKLRPTAWQGRDT
jgi:hypothetical protein